MCVCEVIVFKLVCVCVKLLYCVDVCKVIVYASVYEVIVCVLLRRRREEEAEKARDTESKTRTPHKDAAALAAALPNSA